METVLKYDWKFIKQDIPGASAKDFDDTGWRTVRVPHDYAIEGPFDPENDKQSTEVVADGVLKPIDMVGRTGGLPIADPAWYRRKFSVSDSAKHVFLEFDGVMSNSTVYVNGIRCGGRPYGYSSFSVDITDAVRIGAENTLAVFVKPKPSSSRWYTGAGIYRDVRLVEKENSYFPYQPVWVRTEVKNGSACVDVSADLHLSGSGHTLHCTILDREGNPVAEETQKCCGNRVYSAFKLKNYHFWNIHNSYLYTLKLELISDGKVCDTYETRFGIRTISFDSCDGFRLNGEKVKLQGVCMHHDLGALGSAFNRAAAERQIQKLVDIGVNAYRCSHNPPHPEILDLCDEYGLVVMDEAFDEWKTHKVPNGYGDLFDEWAERDLTDLIHRDRNHPCVIMWSIGNEIMEQEEKDGWKVARFLHKICKREDPDRPTTAGFNMPLDAFKNGLAQEVDLVGLNYKPHLYEQFHREYPQCILFGSETGSSVSTRGHYTLPAAVEHPVQPKESLMESSYDLASPNWAYPIEKEFFVQDRLDYVIGQFVWTGFDYLGEPTPYRNSWPARSSYFGIYDLAGMEKDRVYSFKAKWTDQKVIHILPHWNWNPGDLVDIHVYSSCDSAELFLNGKSLGIQTKDSEDEIRSNRLIWNQIPFEAGELKVVAVGHPELYDVVKTAGAPSKILVEPERKKISADGDDLTYIRCTVADQNGTPCPDSNMMLRFSVEGPGEYIASDNGSESSTRVFSEPFCDTLHGKCMVIIRSLKGKQGIVKLKVTSQELGSFSAEVESC